MSTFLSLLFLTATWHIGLVLRSIVYITTWVYSFTVWLRYMTSDLTFHGHAIFLVLLITLEISTYVHVKSNVVLFESMKQSEMQEEQLQRVLDIVPDSVLICTQ